MYGVGTILAGKYRIERLIGEGGMGMVVAATHLHLGTQVALKFLNQDMASNQQMAERFMREARASALLKSEHVCRVSDVGMLDNGAPYIVMELLNGQDLSSLLKNHGPMPIATAADYVLQALVAIAEAHAATIVHRDLKPGNLFWTQRPDGSHLIKVLDFGIAKAPGSANFSMTQTSTVMGSPGYMSPEQLKSSKDVDARSDIWSMGIVLYELVTGRTPFSGESITEITLRVAMDPTPVLPTSFPLAFQQVIARCLEKNPAQRFQDVADLAQALAQFAGPRGQEAANAVTRVLRGHNAVAPTMHAVGGGVQTGRPVTTPTTLGAATGAVVGSQPRGRGALIGGIAALCVVGGVIGVVLATRGGGGDDKNAASQPPPPAVKENVATPTTPKEPETPKEPPPPQTPKEPVKVAEPPVTPDAAVAETKPPADAATQTASTTPPKDPPPKKTPKKTTPKKVKDVGDDRN